MDVGWTAALRRVLSLRPNTRGLRVSPQGPRPRWSIARATLDKARRDAQGLS